MGLAARAREGHEEGEYPHDKRERGRTDEFLGNVLNGDAALSHTADTDENKLVNVRHSREEWQHAMGPKTEQQQVRHAPPRNLIGRYFERI